MNSEFDIINQYFAKYAQSKSSQDLVLGIGDDCAVLAPDPRKLLVVSVDTLISGVHFPQSTSAADIAYKSLCVNLSDLAAMGARPAWFTLALSLPESDAKWLTDFSQSLFATASYYGIHLIGGDTTKGPLSITVQVMGYVDKHAYITRSGAKAGDRICVTGKLGAAALGLKLVLLETQLDCPIATQAALRALNRPEPRLAEGLKLTTIARAGLDISDGLLADLQHLLDASNVGAIVNVDDLPIASCVLSHCKRQEALKMAMTGGDDYELCFTLPKDTKDDEVLRGVDFTCIGQITHELGLQLMDGNGERIKISGSGYDHFVL